MLTKLSPRPPGTAQRAKEWVGNGILRLAHGVSGEFVEKAIPTAVGAIGIAQAFQWIAGLRWGLGAVALLLAELFLIRFRRGAALRALLAKFATASGEYAGQLDTVVVRLSRNPDRHFSEAACKALCVGLLSRLRDFAEIAFDVTGDVHLRATLAVPVLDEHTSPIAVRVWCYDRPYQERRWTVLPLGLAGAPTSFESGTIEIIRDIRRVAGVKDADQRPYRSVGSIPVKAGGPEGATLAVVSLDARAPDFFQRENVEQRLVPLAQSVVNTIALVLSLRRSGEPYEFED